MIGSIGGPVATDGSPFVSPCIFPSGVYLQLLGASDDSSVEFQITSEEHGEIVKEWGYNDWVLMAGGGMVTEGGKAGDWCSLSVYCPATVVVPNAGGTGNCNVVNGIIVPAAMDGAFDVDLDEANPVLTPLKDGFWEWSFSLTGRGVVTIGDPGKAGAHLVAADYLLARFAHRLPIIGNQHFNLTIPAIEPKIVLPQWKTKVSVHNSGHTGLVVGWYLTVARVKTT